MKLSTEERTKVLMQRKNYTYTRLANELGISVGYLSDIIKGNRSGEKYWDKIKKILSGAE